MNEPHDPVTGSAPSQALTRSLGRETSLVLGIVGVLLAVSAVCWWGFSLVGALPTPQSFTVQLPWWVLAAAFACTELVVLHIQVKREAQTVSLSELPLVLGLFFAAAPALLIGRLVGSALVFVVHRRSSPLKTVFNLALICAETSLAVVTFQLVAGDPAGFGPQSWIAAYAGALLANVLGALAIGLVIAVYEGGLRLRVLLVESVVGQPTAPMVVTLALLAVISLSVTVQSTWLLLASATVLLFGYRAYAALSDRHLSLERLYHFSQVVTNSPEINEVLDSVLSEAKDLLRTEQAEVVFVAQGGSVTLARVRLGVDGKLTRVEGEERPEDIWLRETVAKDSASLLMQRGSREPATRRWLDIHGLREAIVVPLRGSAGIIGTLAVADRLGEVRTFDREDLLLLETVGNHASMALQKGELIDQLRHDALHDALTSLPNRVNLQRHLAESLDDVAGDRSPGTAVMILDLDGFKDVNDTLGHQQGDLLLIEVAERLVTAVGAHGLVGRLGGDEFCVILSGVIDEEPILRIARRMLTALEQPIVLDGLEIQVSGSLGIALAPMHATESAALLKRADMAMYDAKTSARGLRIYESDIDTNSPRRLTLVGELRTALQNGGLQINVQPQANCATGEVRSVEVLSRWYHPELGTVSPDEFIPIAERSGLIGTLTTSVLDASLAACAQWRAMDLDINVAVNLSARSLLDADLVDDVTRLLRRHSVPAHMLTLEVTESAVMVDPARATALLLQLHELGTRLSVDDFGTGYSSLSYLQRLPVQEVKIDRSFVIGLREGSDDATIVRSIVDLGRNLGLEVVAEGVEDQPTWDLLAAMGCTVVQGWHLSRPMPVNQFSDWMAERRPDVPMRPTLRAI